MTGEHCFWFGCLVPLDVSGPGLFAFINFLPALTLMVLAWNIVDIRYRFRTWTAPLPLQRITFGAVVVIGVLTLLTDLWRAEHRLVPRGDLITPSEWQATLAGLYVLTFLLWAWFAFICPPKFGWANAKRYANNLYRIILKGDPNELAVVADELRHSIPSMVRHAPDMRELNEWPQRHGGKPKKVLTVSLFADDMLRLIGDRRFCRAIVKSAPLTALALFSTIGKEKKYGVRVGTFAKNIMNEGIANRDSFMYNEAEPYESGLLAVHKPLSQAMFANYELVEEVKTLLEPDLGSHQTWDVDQWEAYARVVLIAFQKYVESGMKSHSYVLYGAMQELKESAISVYRVGDFSKDWGLDEHQRLRVVTQFMKDAITILDKNNSSTQRFAIPKEYSNRTFYDHIASIIVELISKASMCQSPVGLCWSVQHNAVWSAFFNFDHTTGRAATIIKAKVRRLVYKEIVTIEKHQDFQAARILGLCLNVMGLSVSKDSYYHDSRALQLAVLRWTKKRYAWVYSENPVLAAACLVDGFTYEPDNNRIVHTRPADGRRQQASYIYFPVEPKP